MLSNYQPPKMAKSILSVGKYMASIFCNAKGKLLTDYLEKCQTIKSTTLTFGPIKWKKRPDLAR